MAYIYNNTVFVCLSPFLLLSSSNQFRLSRLSLSGLTRQSTRQASLLFLEKPAVKAAFSTAVRQSNHQPAAQVIFPSSSDIKLAPIHPIPRIAALLRRALSSARPDTLFPPLCGSSGGLPASRG